jgi:hypothetical protein
LGLSIDYFHFSPHTFAIWNAPASTGELGTVRAFAVLRDARVGEGPLLGRELESQLRAIHV